MLESGLLVSITLLFLYKVKKKDSVFYKILLVALFLHFAFLTYFYTDLFYRHYKTGTKFTSHSSDDGEMYSDNAFGIYLV